MNVDDNAVDISFRSRFAGKAFWPSLSKGRFAADTKLKYNSYQNDGKTVFTVTLSTYVSSEKLAKSDRMRKFWVHEFLYRVAEQLPYKLKESIDHDYVIERSDEGFFHYHGLLPGTPARAMIEDLPDRSQADTTSEILPSVAAPYDVIVNPWVGRRSLICIQHIPRLN